MNAITALARQAYMSILGSLSSGIPGGGPTANNISQINAAPLGPSATLQWDSSPYVSRTGRVLVMGTMSITGGTMVNGDGIVGDLLQDGVTISAQTFTDVTGLTANVAQMMIVSVTPGATHTFSVAASVGGGHTGTVQTGRAVIVCIDL